MSIDSLQHHCRVFGISAPAAPIVALLRRGPSRWVQLIRWHTDIDTFVAGQWLRGHVYQRRCSLSPNGQLFVYFVAKINGRTLHDDEFTHAWTAVSRPPYFTALALWPKGDTWNGGGVFRDDRTLLLNHWDAEMHRQARTKYIRVVVGKDIPWYQMGENEPVYSAILAQQGWQLIQKGHIDDKSDQVRRQMQTPNEERRKLHILLTTADIWQKPHAAGRFMLRQTFYGVDYNQYGDAGVMDWDLIDATSSHTQRIEHAEWADWDQQGRLLFTRQGQVWAGQPEQYPDDLVCLADLNEHRPERIRAPAWARHWHTVSPSAPATTKDHDDLKGTANG